MASGTIYPAGLSGLRGLVRGCVPDNMIHSFAKRAVSRRFEIERPILPVAKSSESLHVHSLAAIDVSGTGCFLYYPKLVSFRPPWPELTAHFVYGAECFKCINGDLMYRRA